MDFSSQGPPFTSVVDTLSSGGKVPVKEGRDELDFWLVLATIGKKGKSSPPGLEALLEIYGSSVKRRPSWSLNSTTTSLPILSALFERDPQTLLESMLSSTLRQKSELLHSSHWFDLALSETQNFRT